MHRYEVVPAQDVPQKLQEAAGRMVEFCRRHLGLPEVEVVWFRRCGPGPMYSRRYPHAEAFEATENLKGQAPRSGDTIGLCCDLAPLEVLQIAAHEMRHVWQIHAGKDWGREEDERDAWAYTARAYDAISYWPGSPIQALNVAGPVEEPQSERGFGAGPPQTDLWPQPGRRSAPVVDEVADLRRRKEEQDKKYQKRALSDREAADLTTAVLGAFEVKRRIDRGGQRRTGDNAKLQAGLDGLEWLLKRTAVN